MRRGPSIVTLACRRALPGTRADVVEVPCAGRVSVALLLRYLRQGADGVVVAVCAKDRCLHDGGFLLAQQTVNTTNALLGLAGAERPRIRLIGTGPETFETDVAEAEGSLVALPPLGIRAGLEPSTEPRGVDAAIDDLETIAALRQDAEARPSSPEAQGPLALHAGRVRVYGLLLDGALRDEGPSRWIRAASELLGRARGVAPVLARGIGCGAEWSDAMPGLAANLASLAVSSLAEHGSRIVVALSAQDAKSLATAADGRFEVLSWADAVRDTVRSLRPLAGTRLAVVDEAGAGTAELLEAAGAEVVELGHRDPLLEGNGLAWTAVWTRTALETLNDAGRLGASALVTSTLPLSLRFALWLRTGGWIETPVHAMHITQALVADGSGGPA